MTRQPRQPRLRPPTRYVYVIGPETGLQKVGLATDPKARLAALQTASAHDLVLHVAVPVPFGEGHAVERRAHRALARCCVRNEWFDTTPAEAMAAVRSAAAPRMALPEQPGGGERRLGRGEHPPAKLASQPLRAPVHGALPLFEFQPPSRVMGPPFDALNGCRFQVR